MLPNQNTTFCVNRNIVNSQLYYFHFLLRLLRSSFCLLVSQNTQKAVFRPPSSAVQQSSSTVWSVPEKQDGDGGRTNNRAGGGGEGTGHQRRCLLVNPLQLNSTLTSLQSLLTAYTQWVWRPVIFHESSTLGYVNCATVSPVFRLSSSRLLCPWLYSGLLRTQTSESSAVHIRPHLARWEPLRRSDRLESPVTFSYFHWFLCWCQSLKYVWHLVFFIWLL